MISEISTKLLRQYVRVEKSLTAADEPATFEAVTAAMKITDKTTLSNLKQALAATRMRREITYDDESTAFDHLVIDAAGNAEIGGLIKQLETKEKVEKMLQSLDPRERRIIELRYMEGLGQEQIGLLPEFGISTQRIDQIQKRAEDKIRQFSDDTEKGASQQVFIDQNKIEAEAGALTDAIQPVLSALTAEKTGRELAKTVRRIARQLAFLSSALGIPFSYRLRPLNRRPLEGDRMLPAQINKIIDSAGSNTNKLCRQCDVSAETLKDWISSKKLGIPRISPFLTDQDYWLEIVPQSDNGDGDNSPEPLRRTESVSSSESKSTRRERPDYSMKSRENQKVETKTSRQKMSNRPKKSEDSARSYKRVAKEQTESRSETAGLDLTSDEVISSFLSQEFITRLGEWSQNVRAIKEEKNAQQLNLKKQEAIKDLKAIIVQALAATERPIQEQQSIERSLDIQINLDSHDKMTRAVNYIVNSLNAKIPVYWDGARYIPITSARLEVGQSKPATVRTEVVIPYGILSSSQTFLEIITEMVLEKISGRTFDIHESKRIQSHVQKAARSIVLSSISPPLNLQSQEPMASKETVGVAEIVIPPRPTAPQNLGIAPPLAASIAPAVYEPIRVPDLSRLSPDERRAKVLEARKRLEQQKKEREKKRRFKKSTRQRGGQHGNTARSTISMDAAGNVTISLASAQELFLDHTTLVRAQKDLDDNEWAIFALRRQTVDQSPRTRKQTGKRLGIRKEHVAHKTNKIIEILSNYGEIISPTTGKNLTTQYVSEGTVEQLPLILRYAVRKSTICESEAARAVKKNMRLREARSFVSRRSDGYRQIFQKWESALGVGLMLELKPRDSKSPSPKTDLTNQIKALRKQLPSSQGLSKGYLELPILSQFLAALGWRLEIKYDPEKKPANRVALETDGSLTVYRPDTRRTFFDDPNTVNKLVLSPQALSCAMTELSTNELHYLDLLINGQTPPAKNSQSLWIQIFGILEKYGKLKSPSNKTIINNRVKGQIKDFDNIIATAVRTAHISEVEAVRKMGLQIGNLSSERIFIQSGLPGWQRTLEGLQAAVGLPLQFELLDIKTGLLPHMSLRQQFVDIATAAGFAKKQNKRLSSYMKIKPNEVGERKRRLEQLSQFLVQSGRWIEISIAEEEHSETESDNSSEAEASLP